MTKNLLPEDGEESLRFENELLKIKLRAEFGAINIGNFPKHEVPPEVENEFLKTFEKVELFLRSAESHEEVRRPARILWKHFSKMILSSGVGLYLVS
ncbi:MAG: hypothetical protein IPP34_16880 [Bacteroidetes bacterium]|nr:hypothetical protein [Bacteroidota bacterium]